MNLPFYIARRYFFSRKSTNVINLISAIAVLGVAFGTAALIVVLSVFNGFVWMSKSMLNAFNPDLLVISSKGKIFERNILDSTLKKYLSQIEAYSYTLSENALIEYDGKQYLGVVKGVDDQFTQVTGIDTMMLYGEFSLHYKGTRPMAVVGAGVANALGVQLNFLGSLKLWLPRPNSKISMDLSQIFNRCFIFPSGVFAVQQEYDNKYVFVPLDFLQNNLNVDSNIVSSVEIKVDNNIDVDKLELELQQSLGDDYIVKNRFEQEEMFYKIVRSERLAVIVILSFIIIIASFNVIGTLSMLIIDKKQDIETLRYLGANKNLISKIFTIEGSLITIFGLIFGLIIGVGLVAIQYKFGIIKFPSNTGLMYIPYPVIIKVWDIFLTVLIVSLIGFLAARLPVRYFTKKYFIN